MEFNFTQKFIQIMFTLVLGNDHVVANNIIINFFTVV